MRFLAVLGKTCYCMIKRNRFLAALEIEAMRLKLAIPNHPKAVFAYAPSSGISFLLTIPPLHKSEKAVSRQHAIHKYSGILFTFGL